MKILPILHHNGNTDFYITLKYFSTLSDRIYVIGETDEIKERCKELKLTILPDIEKEEYDYILYLYSGDNISGGDITKEIKISKDADIIYIFSVCDTNKTIFFKNPILYKKKVPFHTSIFTSEYKVYTASFDFSMSISASTLESQIVFLSTRQNKDEYIAFLLEFYKYILTGDKIRFSDGDLKITEFVAENEYQNKRFFDSFVRCKKIPPLLRLAEDYVEKKDPITAYMFSRMSLELEDSEIYFFNKRDDYLKNRYTLFADICLQIGKIEEGRLALAKLGDDDHPLKKKYREIEGQDVIKTKKQFFNVKVEEYRKMYPKLTGNQILTKIKNEWKKREKQIKK